ncbi:MAG: hypothetical protein Q7S68_05460, partial [Deltaproteobacteria bacterium]|nr:hypothetical protein [Deltaproteobacteria bacterium]
MAACGGEDYTPVYFDFSGDSNGGKDRPNGTPTAPSLSDKIHCQIDLTATLCVKFKGENIDIGSDANDPMCAETPPIPFLIDGPKVTLKGSDFPDIQVSIDLKGTQTPITINGRGQGDGSDNIGFGTWTPDGHLSINDFSFFISVLGISAEIPGIDFTTKKTQELPDLPIIEGKPMAEDGSVRLVSGLVLSSLFEAADKFLFGASLQATLDGKFNPSLSQCGGGTNQEQTLKIVKLFPQQNGRTVEKPLPDENILEIAQGTFIATGPQDVGSRFETRATFKAQNIGRETLKIHFPTKVGPFYFETDGLTETSLAPNKEMKFKIVFRPTTEETPEAGTVKEEFTLGRDHFVLSGVALDPTGRIGADQIDDAGTLLAENLETLSFDAQTLPAGPVKNFFTCQPITCEEKSAVTACQPCNPSTSRQQCLLKAINEEGNPIEEVNADCHLLHPDSQPRMSVALNGEAAARLQGSKRTITFQNRGVAEMTINKIWIEEEKDSRSTGEFTIGRQTLPITIQTAGEKFLLSVTYLPKDIIGFDGQTASTGMQATDKAWLVIETDTGITKIELTGKTDLQEVPDLQAVIAAPTGNQTLAPFDTFTFRGVTAASTDIAYPLFLKLNESATEGIRITAIQITGQDASFFEWLDSCLIDGQLNPHFISLGSQGFDLKPESASGSNLPLFGCINFHRNPAEPLPQNLFRAKLQISGIQLDSFGKIKRNADGSSKQSDLQIDIMAAVDPLKGKMVLRIPQTLFILATPQAPSVSGVPTKEEGEILIAEGRTAPIELSVFLGALILDPFDEMEITDSQKRIINEPGDGKTAVFRAIETRPSAVKYEEENLFDNATLLHDSTSDENLGTFHDYNFEGSSLPDPLRVNGWRIFTGALSYPGPLHPRAPISMSECEVIDPCDSKAVRKFSDAGVGPDGIGACSFFYATSARYHSPAFEPVIRNEVPDFCATRDQPQDLLAMDLGHYSVDGSITFEDLGLRFWGPTYIHNPNGPLGFVPPLDEILHISFTTEMLKPTSGPKDYTLIPDEKIDFAKQEYKVQLTDSDFAICPTNVQNRTFRSKRYSSWKYLAPLLFKDEAGTIPAGCP